MDLQNVMAVASKDFEAYKRKKSVMAYTVGLPLVLSVAFTLVVQNQIAPNIQNGVNPDSLNLGLESLIYFFVIFAAVLPTSIAAYSIVGEKVEKSLEPMLATPLTDGEILLGKTISSLVPPILATWLGASIFMAASDYLLLNSISYYYFPNLNASVMLFILAPLAALFGVEVAVIASSRISDVRGANQLGGLVWIPFMVIFIYAVRGNFQFSVGNLLIISGILAVLELALFSFTTSTFKREQILTKWK
jgi:ABC-2 type transport system permease protein